MERLNKINTTLINILSDRMPSGEIQILDEVFVFKSCCINCSAILKMIKERLSIYLLTNRITSMYVIIGKMENKKVYSYMSENPLSVDDIVDYIKKTRNIHKIN